MLFRIATCVFFGWLILDVLAQLFGLPISDVYYPIGWKRPTEYKFAYDWRAGSSLLSSTARLLLFAGIWIGLRRFRGLQGFRYAAFVSSFPIVMYAVVPLVSADMYDLKINWIWSLSMWFCATVFFWAPFSDQIRR